MVGSFCEFYGEDWVGIYVVGLAIVGCEAISTPLVSAGLRNRTDRRVEWFRRTGRAAIVRGMDATYGCPDRAIRWVHTSLGVDSWLRVGVKSDPRYRSFP